MSLTQAIADVDPLDCAKRYLCEVAASPAELISENDAASLELLRAGPGIAGC